VRVAHDGAVTVIFVDGADGKEVGRSTLPADQIPENLDAGTTVDIAGTTWLVEQAEPYEAAERRASPTLTLILRRAATQVVPARDILFSLPSICDALPPVAGTRSGASAFEIHEDEWRQVEMVAGRLSDVIDSELHAIRVIYDEHARRASNGAITGFSAIHVRSQPARPLPRPLPLRQVLGRLPQPDRQYDGVAFDGATGVAAGSFAVSFGPVSLYGLAEGDAIEVLCLDNRATPDAVLPPSLISSVQEVLAAFDLVMVDWCRCSVIGPASVAAYLSDDGSAGTSLLAPHPRPVGAQETAGASGSNRNSFGIWGRGAGALGRWQG
jgi:hypothetical protein